MNSLVQKHTLDSSKYLSEKLVEFLIGAEPVHFNS